MTLFSVYANALLANLNARESLRGRGYFNDGTISLNWSALRTNYNELLVLNKGEVHTWYFVSPYRDKS